MAVRDALSERYVLGWGAKTRLFRSCSKKHLTKRHCEACEAGRGNLFPLSTHRRSFVLVRCYKIKQLGSLVTVCVVSSEESSQEIERFIAYYYFARYYQNLEVLHLFKQELIGRE